MNIHQVNWLGRTIDGQSNSIRWLRAGMAAKTKRHVTTSTNGRKWINRRHLFSFNSVENDEKLAIFGNCHVTFSFRLDMKIYGRSKNGPFGGKMVASRDLKKKVRLLVNWLVPRNTTKVRPGYDMVTWPAADQSDTCLLQFMVRWGGRVGGGGGIILIMQNLKAPMTS